MRIVMFFLLSVIVSSCTCSRYNDQGDVKAAEQIANRFYYGLMSKDYKSIYPHISNSFWEVTDSASFRQSIEKLNEEYGNMIDFKLVDWQTNVVLGTQKTFGEYILVYKNKYEKAETIETLTFKYEDDGQTRMVGYDVKQNKLNINIH